MPPIWPRRAICRRRCRSPDASTRTDRGHRRRVEAVAALPDPVGETIDGRKRPNGLVLDRVRVPIGVIGIIYESRPNVTADAGALCVMAGNAAILRGGSEAQRSNAALHAASSPGWRRRDCRPMRCSWCRPRTARWSARCWRRTGLIDLIVPRGGKGLVARVQAEARVPVLAHLDGINHVYVDAAADPAMARGDGGQRQDAPDRRVRGDGDAADRPRLCRMPTRLVRARCARPPGCDESGRDDATWDTEYLDAIAAVAVVDGVDGALAHIARHGSHHTDAIVTDDAAVAERFLAEVDSAIVLWNASTQFADGGEFGLGAEIGIATGRLHARGPVALEGLTTYKWVVRGTGQVRGLIRIGLLGGSRSIPRIAGIAAITLAAIRALGLDEVWWLVSPGNPLKPADGHGAARRAARLGRRDGAPRADPRDRDRGAARHALHRRHARASSSARYPQTPLHLADGRGQSRAVPPLARLARHRARRCRLR